MKRRLRKPLSVDWYEIQGFWTRLQILPPQIIRWAKHGKGGTRRQDDLQHQYAMEFLADVMIEWFEPYLTKIDELLVLRAVRIHDHGEGERGIDVYYADHTSADDVAEWEAVRKAMSKLPVRLSGKYERAFLLQFVRGKTREAFSEKPRKIIEELARTRRNEAMLYDAIEVVDYILFGVEEYRVRGKRDVLRDVIGNVLPRIKNLRATLPGFDELWLGGLGEKCQRITEMEVF